MDQDWARPMVHWEIEAKDAEKMAAFYRALCNWEIGEGPGRVRQIGPGIGAPETITGHILAGESSRVVLYIQVLSLAESLDRLPGLGGSVLREPFDVPNGPTVAWIADPEGNRVVLVQQ